MFRGMGGFKSLFVVSCVGITACQTMPYEGQARDVKRRPQIEGVVSIAIDSRPEDRAKAEERMKSNCLPYSYNVIEEGEVVVGQETHTRGRETDRESTEFKAGSFLGIPIYGGEAGGRDMSSSSVTKAVKEWHISYKCDRKNRVVR